MLVRVPLSLANTGARITSWQSMMHYDGSSLAERTTMALPLTVRVDDGVVDPQRAYPPPPTVTEMLAVAKCP